VYAGGGSGNVVRGTTSARHGWRQFVLNSPTGRWSSTSALSFRRCGRAGARAAGLAGPARCQTKDKGRAVWAGGLAKTGSVVCFHPVQMPNYDTLTKSTSDATDTRDRYCKLRCLEDIDRDGPIPCRTFDLDSKLHGESDKAIAGARNPSGKKIQNASVNASY
ncbi:hypothetical protein THAOC_22075, partial [Thalassiosira oceanica]